VLAAAQWPDVLSRAELLSRRHAKTGGHRGLEILHVATALHHRFLKNRCLAIKGRMLATSETFALIPSTRGRLAHHGQRVFRSQHGQKI
jgi:hypothetical protein